MTVAGRCTVVAMQKIDGWVGGCVLVGFWLRFFTVLGIFVSIPYWEPAVFSTLANLFLILQISMT